MSTNEDVIKVKSMLGDSSKMDMIKLGSSLGGQDSHTLKILKKMREVRRRQLMWMRLAWEERITQLVMSQDSRRRMLRGGGPIDSSISASEEAVLVLSHPSIAEGIGSTNGL